MSRSQNKSKVRAHARVLASFSLLAYVLKTYRLPVNSPKTLEESILPRTQSLYIRKTSVTCLFSLRICAHIHMPIFTQTPHAHCASSDKPHPFRYDIIILTSPMVSLVSMRTGSFGYDLIFLTSLIGSRSRVLHGHLHY